jgi:putative spermidine/putrescine transport system permease protein
MIPRGMRLCLAAYAGLVCLLSVLPVLIIVIESFTASDYVVFPPKGLSLKWYAEAAQRQEFVDSAFLSLGIALVACIIATVLGTLVALALVRYRFPGRQVLQSLFMAPLSVPGIIFGLALLQFFSAWMIPRENIAVVIGHVIIALPFAIRFVTVSLVGMVPNVELAAQSLGADRWSVFRRITLPLIRPGVVASLVFAFILSFDDVAVALFLATPGGTTLPVRIYAYIDQSYDPLIAAVSAIVVLVAFLALALIERSLGIGRLFGLRQG